MGHVGAGLWDGKHGDRWQAVRDSPVRPQHTRPQAQQDTLRPLFDALKVASVQTVRQLRVLHCGQNLPFLLLPAVCLHSSSRGHGKHLD